jgi:hypothetical protein
VFYTSAGPVRPCIFTYITYILYVSIGRSRGTIISSQKDHRELREHPGGGGFKMGSGNREHSSLLEDPARGGVLYQEDMITCPGRGHYSILSGCKWATSRTS